MKHKLHRFRRQLTADKKKFGLMVTTLAVGLLLWGRLILLEKVPRIATADPAGNPAQSDKNAGSKPEGGIDALPEVRVDLDDRLAINLFAFRHNRYKLLPDVESGRIGIQSHRAADDEQQRTRELVRRAKALHLQSVVQGAWPVAVINGQVLRVGDSIDGFEIASINERSAKVTRDGLTFTLTMLSD